MLEPPQTAPQRLVTAVVLAGGCCGPPLRGRIQGITRIPLLTGSPSCQQYAVPFNQVALLVMHVGSLLIERSVSLLVPLEPLGI
jgi:hypothetical protein